MQPVSKLATNLLCIAAGLSGALTITSVQKQPGRLSHFTKMSTSGSAINVAENLSSLYVPPSWLDSPEKLATFVTGHDNFLLDCDGVLWAGGGPLPGAVLTVEALRQAGKRVIFITNNSSKSRRQYAKQLTDFGVPTSPNDVVTSGSAMANYLKKEGITTAYVVGEDGLVEELVNSGIQCVRENKNEKPSMNESEFLNLSLDPTAQAVCVGWDRAFTFRHICVASAYLQHGCRFIGANPDNADRVGKLLFPGTGPLLAAIKNASGITPTIIGKPNPLLLQQILDNNFMDPLRTVMVGDRLDTDMAFANSGGITSVLVLTGVSSEDDILSLSDVELHMKPSYVMASLASLLPALSRVSSL